MTIKFNYGYKTIDQIIVSVIVGDDKNKEMGSFGGGGRRDLNYFDDNLIKEYAKNAVFQAITNLNAKPAPAVSSSSSGVWLARYSFA